ncbi:MAG: glycerol-3-phosphate acyltransferase [Actinomycetota bacterium]
MTSLLAALVGYLWGGIPTADFLARRRGVDLRAEGSRNPGANNALRLGGPRLAAAVLAVEMNKGAIAAWLGGLAGGDPAMVAAGIGAIAGNIYNPFLRRRGGKGLGITAGVTLAAWPTVIVPVLLVLAGTLIITRRSGIATIVTITFYLAAGWMWADQGWPTGWGLTAGPGLLWLGLGVAVLLIPKAWRDAQNPMTVEHVLRPPSRRSFR